MTSGNAINGAAGGSLSSHLYPKRRETPEKRKKTDAEKRIDAKRKETRARIEGLGGNLDVEA